MRRRTCCKDGPEFGHTHFLGLHIIIISESDHKILEVSLLDDMERCFRIDYGSASTDFSRRRYYAGINPF